MKKAYIKYLLALLLFGSNGIVASYVLLTSYEIVYLRTLLGSIFLIILFLLTKQNITFWHNKLHLFYLTISGMAMGASWIFLFEAYAQIGVSIATLAYYCGPVIVMMLSPLLFRERMTIAKGLGFTAVFIGMALVNRQAFLEGEVSVGLLLGLLAAVMYAVMVIFNKKAASITGLENATGQLIISFLTVTVYTVNKQGFFVEIAEGSIIPILILGIVNTGLGCYFYFSSIGQLPVQSVSILGYLEPLSALLLSALLLNETLSAMQLIGAFLILGGAAYGELYKKKRRNEGHVT